MSHSTTRGERLVSKGYLSREQLSMAQRRHQEAPHLSLEEICLQMGFLSEDDFRKVLDEHTGRPRLGGLLVKEGIISESQLAKALAIQRRSGGLLGQILIRMGCFDEDKLVELLGRQFKVPFVPVGSLRPDRSLRRILNATYALRHGVVPVALAGRRLTVAISDPTYRKPLDELSSLTGFEVDVVLTTPNHVDKLRTILYSEEESEESDTEEIPMDTVFTEVNLPAPMSGPEEPESLVRALLAQALEENASSIHFDPGEHGPRLLLRVEGQLQDFGAGDLGSRTILHYRNVVRKLKSLAKLDPAERRKPQQGWLRVEKTQEESSETSSFHLTIVPTRFGESVTLRVVAGGRPTRTLEGLGFSEDVTEEIRQILHWPHGIFLVAGPAAAGKSSTAWACAQYLERAGRKVVALTTEQGFTIPNVVQFDVGGEIPDGTLGYFGDCDPDVILVDEIRTAQMAAWAMEWARSGRMVIASVTALGARSAMGFLRSLGVDMELLSEHVSAFLGQRLLRCICPDCAVPAERETGGSALLDDILPSEGDWKRGIGCASCRQTGLLGRMPVSELWYPRWHQGGSDSDRAQFTEPSVHPVANGWSPFVLFRQHLSQVTMAAQWIAQGRTTTEELLRCFALWELEQGLQGRPVLVDVAQRQHRKNGETRAA